MQLVVRKSFLALLCFVLVHHCKGGLYIILSGVVDPPVKLNPAVTDPEGLAVHIKYHAKYSPVFDPQKFDAKQAYFATAQSVREKVIHRWNESYKHFQTTNVKAVHYLSMEFLQVVLW